MLKDVKKRLTNVFANKKFIVVLVVTIIFIAAALYTYTRYVVPRLNPTYVPNKEFISDDNGAGSVTDTADLYFFYTEWCPHCKAAKTNLGKT